jgi:uncharacterized membrane protein
LIRNGGSVKLLKGIKSININFLKCGITGWCLEVLWTGIINMCKKDKKLSSNTSLIMFPIYGMAAFIKPFYKYIKNKNMMIRGSFYTILIYAAEYTSGCFLKKHDMCPWDYSKSKFNIKGIIRLDYAPAWFIVGLIYEKLLNK